MSRRRVNSTPRWLNGALTGVVLTSAVVAALDRQGQGPNPVDDIAWILITLASTGLGAIRTVLGVNVAILLGLGIYGASKAGYRPFQAAALGVADAAFGLVVIAANALLK
jgi:hypothetical protein